MSTPDQTIHCRLSGKYQIRFVRDCQKTYPTMKYLKNQKQNMKKHYQKVDIQQSYHIPTIHLTITTQATGTVIPQLQCNLVQPAIQYECEKQYWEKLLTTYCQTLPPF